MAQALTVDDHMTAIVNAPSLHEAITYVRALPERMRRQLADLLYIETLSPVAIASEARS
jgi:hypothetical protein